jgi:hypothetical protein
LKESSACCGVNLALQDWGELVPKWACRQYFWAEQAVESLETVDLKDSSACCGVNLALRDWVFPELGDQIRASSTFAWDAEEKLVEKCLEKAFAACCGMNLALHRGEGAKFSGQRRSRVLA